MGSHRVRLLKFREIVVGVSAMRGLMIRLLATLAALLVATLGLAQRGGRRGGGTHTPPPELSSDALYSNPAFTEGGFDPSSNKPEYIERKLSTNEQPPCFQWPMAPRSQQYNKCQPDERP